MLRQTYIPYFYNSALLIIRGSAHIHDLYMHLCPINGKKLCTQLEIFGENTNYRIYHLCFNIMQKIKYSNRSHNPNSSCTWSSVKEIVAIYATISECGHNHKQWTIRGRLVRGRSMSEDVLGLALAAWLFLFYYISSYYQPLAHAQ